MKKICKTEQEFAHAMKEKADYIEIVGDWSKKVIRIKAVGKCAWIVCIGALGTAILLVLASPGAAVVTAPMGGAGGAISFTGGLVAAAPAVPVLGSATVAAISIGAAAGGAGILNELRDHYTILVKKNNYLLLKRK